jgi:hypothetical protein
MFATAMENSKLAMKNYDYACGLLKNRYEDKRAIMGEDFEIISNLPPTKSHDCDSIKLFTDTIRESVYNLEVMGFLLPTSA